MIMDSSATTVPNTGSNLNTRSDKNSIGAEQVIGPLTGVPRSYKVRAIKVTTSSGNTFDGDEVSQDRMVRAIQTAEITGLKETTWKLADNSKVIVTLDELKEALALSAQKMSEIWMKD
jgi:LmbE family N-acetylglucosaminyl deacetylase